MSVELYTFSKHSTVINGVSMFSLFLFMLKICNPTTYSQIFPIDILILSARGVLPAPTVTHANEKLHSLNLHNLTPVSQRL